MPAFRRAGVRVRPEPDSARVHDGVPRHLDAGVRIPVDPRARWPVRERDRHARVRNVVVETRRAAGEDGARGTRPARRAPDFHAARGERAATHVELERAFVHGGVGLIRLGQDAGVEVVVEDGVTRILAVRARVGVAPAHVDLAAPVLERVAAEVEARRLAGGGVLHGVRQPVARLERDGHVELLRIIGVAPQHQDAVQVRRGGERQDIGEVEILRHVLVERLVRIRADARGGGEARVHAQERGGVGTTDLADVDGPQVENVAAAGRREHAVRPRQIGNVHAVAGNRDAPRLVCGEHDRCLEGERAFLMHDAALADRQGRAADVDLVGRVGEVHSDAFHRERFLQGVRGDVGPHDDVLHAGHGRVLVGGGIVERAGEVRDHELGGAGGEGGG